MRGRIRIGTHSYSRSEALTFAGGGGEVGVERGEDRRGKGGRARPKTGVILYTLIIKLLYILC